MRDEAQNADARVHTRESTAWRAIAHYAFEASDPLVLCYCIKFAPNRPRIAPSIQRRMLARIALDARGRVGIFVVAPAYGDWTTSAREKHREARVLAALMFAAEAASEER